MGLQMQFIEVPSNPELAFLWGDLVEYTRAQIGHLFSWWGTVAVRLEGFSVRTYCSIAFIP